MITIHEDIGTDTFSETGYSAEHVDAVLKGEAAKKKKEDEEEKRRKEKERHRYDHDRAIDLHRPTYIKVRAQHLHPNTLEFYQLPWMYDPVRLAYFITMQTA